MPKLLSGAEIVFKALEDQKVEYIFGYPGGAVLPIYDELKNVLDTDSVMVVVEAKHHCISSRGIKDHSSSTVTEMYGGDFNIYNKRDEFYKLLNSVSI